jgi:magnesium-transporting ATPase (P-type)
MLRSLFGRFSFASLISGALASATSMLRYELELARQELRRKMRAVARGIVYVVIGAAFLFFVVSLLIVAAVVALAQVWPLWLAALVVAGGLLVVAIVFLAVGARKIRKNADLRPERAVRAFRRLSKSDRD